MAAPGVAHRGPQAADQLVGDAGQRAAVGHLALDALGHELVVGEDVVGEVAVMEAGYQRCDSICRLD